MFIQSQIFNIAHIPFNVIHINKILRKNSEFSVLNEQMNAQSTELRLHKPFTHHSSPVALCFTFA